MKIEHSLNCQLCGNVFHVQPYRALRAKFCGWSCKQKSAAKKAAVAIAAKYRGTGVVGYIKQNGRHQHRVVAELKLGRPLLSTEAVHHIDGNKHNNSPENLEVMTFSEHTKRHIAEGT